PFFSFINIPRPPRATLFPYTTLFRSANQPKILLMDEPCSALDPISTLQVEELICELKQTYTIIIVTHNMQQAGRVADRTVFFLLDRKSTRLNSSHVAISYAVFCLKKK